jgi:hypothetical protein
MGLRSWFAIIRQEHPNGISLSTVSLALSRSTGLRSLNRMTALIHHNPSWSCRQSCSTQELLPDEGQGV